MNVTMVFLGLFYIFMRRGCVDLPLIMKRIPFGLAACLILIACKPRTTLFTQIRPESSGIRFVNEITEYDTFNILNTEFIYNGAGVAIGDLNGDGLEDLYFAGNQVDNRCYLNLGNLKFKDITEAAGVQKTEGQWSSGVNILDVNTDGKQDIYVCNTLIRNGDQRKNLLFINQGNQGDVPVFKESAAEYGLDDTSHASHAQWLDYDRDGDLDLFIGTNFIDRPRPGTFVKDVNNDCALNCDKLYRNDWDSISGHPRFTDVSQAAGLNLHGYSHSSLVYDFNEDGWPDIYVANDYLSDDLIYINNQDGTFTNRLASMFRHLASSAMGSDLGDINNDGRMEVITAEMLPNTNLRKKTLLGPTNYSYYLYIQEYGYQYQFTRNVLQLNNGLSPETGLPSFSEISFLSGVHETEWSWAPLFADFDRDGLEDLYITNGFPKDVTDHDFGEYRAEANNLVSDMELQELIPIVKIPNFLFRNNGDLSFEDITKESGLSIKSFSNGAAYADLDLDGDLDLVVNNIDDAPFLFKNQAEELDRETNKHHFLEIRLKGTALNPDAIGARVTLFTPRGLQSRLVLSGRGYLSQPSLVSFFGLGEESRIDSILIQWPDGTVQKEGAVAVDQILTFEYAGLSAPVLDGVSKEKLFIMQHPAAFGLDYKHEEKDFIDFNIQKTLPHKMSQYGSPVVVGDINGDGLDDLILGGSAFQQEKIFLQDRLGKFTPKALHSKTQKDEDAEDAAMVLFDADGDGDQDLVIARGSYENLMSDASVFQVLFFTNDGKGNFSPDTLAIPTTARTSASVVRAADIDQDGDLDLFVGGRVLPGYYPKADKSFILINQPAGGKARFILAPDSWNAALDQAGIINDALWSDYDNDGRPDLLVATEWGPVTIYKNDGKGLTRVTAPSLDHHTGWWTSLLAGDFDNDGDMDYVAGNYGRNIYFTCSSSEPMTIYAKDFDANGSLDPFISCYWRDTLGVKREYFYHGRDDMLKQLILIRRKFQTYTSFGLATVNQVFTPKELEGAMILKATNMNSVLLVNNGNGDFRVDTLPVEAQFAPLYGMIAQDINGDEFLDLILTGNDYGIELTQGRADAMQGLVLINDGRGGFKILPFQESGFYIPGDSKALVRLTSGPDHRLVTMRNLDSLAVASFRPKGLIYGFQPGEYSGLMEFYSGARRKIEWGSGASINGQSSSVQFSGPGVSRITLHHSLSGSERVITAGSIQ